MPITGATPAACFEQFREHIAELSAKILGTRFPVRVQEGADNTATLHFANARHSNAVPIETKYGKLYLHIAQLLEAEPREGRDYRLRTTKYWYRIYSKPGSQQEPVIRWDFVRAAILSDGPCKNHVQLGRVNGKSIAPPLGTATIDLNKAHIPTGWVLIEEIFRFLINDLGMTPKCGKSAWPNELHQSSEAFFTRFADRP